MVPFGPHRFEIHRIALEQRWRVFDSVLPQRPTTRQIKHRKQHADLVRAGSAMGHIHVEAPEPVGKADKTHHSTQYFALAGSTQRTPPRGSGASPQ